jgi:hypothetical protein
MFVLGKRRLRRAMAPLLAAGLVLALASSASATTSRGALAATEHASYLAQAPGDPHLAVVVHGRRISAYACVGRTLRAFFSGRSGRLVVRLVSEGQWNPDVEQEDSAGYTVWGRKQDNSLRAIHVDSVEAAVERSLSRDS